MKKPRNAHLKRVIVDYKKLNNNILDLLVTKYPDGYDEEDGYSFILKSDSELGESIQYFNAVSPDLVKTFKLKNEETIGKTFEITYTLKIMEEEEDGETFEYEYLTIVKLVKK